ncbi:MAG TPA: cobalamin-independent methionine synthase II family protein [Candidatus Binataceae bacterium]|jgi:5-methyltetrahydropteroyltriglutamate--homocysteine methyltransferase|nr:cobalamin-independent methionine synthase II family protein [Candidatus Binataceae bacterium]
MMRASEAGKAIDRTALQARVRSAVAEVVRRQIDIGMDLVNDGEMSKPSYATYVKDRLSGFKGASGRIPPAADLAEFSSFTRRATGKIGIAELGMPTCDGPVRYENTQAVAQDIDNLTAALGGAKERGFLTAASPGVISFFLGDAHYNDHEKYVGALADAMKTEYQAISQAGFALQVDCPDLAMSRHIHHKDKTLAEFRKIAAMHVEALNHALAGISPDQVRIHLCWGNYEGPHHHDVALRDIIDIVLEARVGAISYEAANPRHEHEWEVFSQVKLPAGKALIPGVIDSVSNFIEHPELIAQRLCRVAELVGRENVLAGTDCGFGTVGVSRVEPEIAWAKLAAIVEGARIATKRLWRK